jgi:hypothetical protein
MAKNGDTVPPAELVELHLDTIEDALEALSRGECLLVVSAVHSSGSTRTEQLGFIGSMLTVHDCSCFQVDDMDRENEGDLICAASKVTTETMAFIIRHSRSVLCSFGLLTRNLRPRADMPHFPLPAALFAFP